MAQALCANMLKTQSTFSDQKTLLLDNHDSNSTSALSIDSVFRTNQTSPVHQTTENHEKNHSPSETATQTSWNTDQGRKDKLSEELKELHDLLQQLVQSQTD